jgi:hypothetical protein
MSISDASEVNLFKMAEFDDGEVLPSVEDRKAEVNLLSELNRIGIGIGHLNSTLVMQNQARSYILGPQLSTMYQSQAGINTQKHFASVTGKALTKVDFG